MVNLICAEKGIPFRIAAVAVRNCDPPRQLNVQWLQLPGGEVESRTVAMSYMVEEC
ncbi:hypothetical protein GHK01_03105 [Sinorhizobium meliloti]|nr:hypothetical protein [Sinorhizobium meliloti]